MATKKGLLRVVRKVCLWCQGKNWTMVQACAQTECSLHGWRLLDQAEDVQVLAALHTFCIQCAGSPEAAAECTADQSIGGHDPCPAHPFRTGKVAIMVQKTRPLPGLGICVEDTKKYAFGKDRENQEIKQCADEQEPEAEKSAPVMHRAVQLPFLMPERIPEAPDI